MEITVRATLLGTDPTDLKQWNILLDFPGGATGVTEDFIVYGMEAIINAIEYTLNGGPPTSIKLWDVDGNEIPTD